MPRKEDEAKPLYAEGKMSDETRRQVFRKSEEDEDEPLLVPRAGQEAMRKEPAHCSNFAVAWLVSVTGILNRIPLIVSPVLVIATCTRLPASPLPSL